MTSSGNGSGAVGPRSFPKNLARGVPAAQMGGSSFEQSGKPLEFFQAI